MPFLQQNLIFNIAFNHLDESVIEKRECLGISYLFLLSNTNKELLPIDKTYFPKFIFRLDQDIIEYWDQYPDGREMYSWNSEQI